MDEEKADKSAPSYRERENLWDQQWPDAEDGTQHPGSETDNLDEELPFPEVVGTSDSMSAVRDAEPYMPPTDPPVLPGGREGIHIATGFGVSPEDEDLDEGMPRGDEELRDRILRILADDSETNMLSLDVLVRNGVVHIRGDVRSLNDAEDAMNLLQFVPGVVDVVDETQLNPAAKG